ncbi:MAG: hypothetical protein AB8B57_02505 [Congregibacter sp.]
MSLEQCVFNQIHIDIARNSTDDFNPFHDPQRWSNIAGNPFAAPIALGFQLEFLCSDRIMRRRALENHSSDALLCFRNFEFNFAGALPRGEVFEIDVRKTLKKTTQGGGLSNRVVVRKSTSAPILIGTQSDTSFPLVHRDAVFGAPGSLSSLKTVADRSTLPDSDLFLKRKYMTTSNAKNFALGALCNQHDYIDELAEHINFAPLFTASLISCALLERGLAQGQNFQAQPMVYTSHQISVDMRVQERLRSNDVLNILVAPPALIEPGKGLGRARVAQDMFHCSAALNDGAVLFNARVQLAPLHALSLSSDA